MLGLCRLCSVLLGILLLLFVRLDKFLGGIRNFTCMKYWWGREGQLVMRLQFLVAGGLVVLGSLDTSI